MHSWNKFSYKKKEDIHCGWTNWKEENERMCTESNWTRVYNRRAEEINERKDELDRTLFAIEDEMKWFILNGDW